MEVFHDPGDLASLFPFMVPSSGAWLTGPQVCTPANEEPGSQEPKLRSGPQVLPINRMMTIGKVTMKAQRVVLVPVFLVCARAPLRGSRAISFLPSEGG